MSSPLYNASSITTLTEIEHIRKNSGMYIGMTTNPNHLLYEVLDNSLDEANMKYASLILVSIDTKTNVCTIADNGRGIPFENGMIPHLAMKLFSGGKFNKISDDSAYDIATGLHGVGLVAVNALCEWMEIVVYRDNKKVSYKFVDCKVAEEKIEDFNSANRPCSTCVRFKPDARYFESIVFSLDPIKTRLEVASAHIEQLKLIFVVDDKKEVIKTNITDYFSKKFYKGSDMQQVTPIFQMTRQVGKESVRILFGWDMNSYSQSDTFGVVNLLPVETGTHINRTFTLFQDVFESIAKKEKLSYNLGDFKIGFRAYTAMEMKTPKYTSQVKEKLANVKTDLDPFYNGLEVDVEKMIRQNPDLFNRIVYFIDSYRKSLNAKKNIIKNTGSVVSRFSQSVDSKLKDCSSTDVARCEIFITEGDSASGGLVQCRDPKYHAILGLRGKIPNLASGKKDFLKNHEIVEIINALGTGVSPDFEVEKLRYSKVVISADGDADGSHISSLVVIMLLKIVPEIFNYGKVYRAVMPLYGTNHNGHFVPFFDTATRDAFVALHPRTRVTRYKGLGEMNPNQLKECLINPNVRRLELILPCTDSDEIFKIMTDAESKRALLDE